MKKELIDLVELKDGIDIKEALETVLVKVNTLISKFVSVATDGLPVMVAKHVGHYGLLKTYPKHPKCIPVQCVVHREHLAPKHFNFSTLL